MSTVTMASYFCGVVTYVVLHSIGISDYSLPDKTSDFSSPLELITI